MEIQLPHKEHALAGAAACLWASCGNLQGGIGALTWLQDGVECRRAGGWTERKAGAGEQPCSDLFLLKL